MAIVVMTRLEFERKRRKISRRILSELADVGQSTIYEIEKHVISNPLVGTMIKIKNGFNDLADKNKKFGPVTLDEICGELIAQ